MYVIILLVLLCTGTISGLAFLGLICLGIMFDL